MLNGAQVLFKEVNTKYNNISLEFVQSIHRKPKKYYFYFKTFFF
jgi:hypothetical protein